MPREEKGGDRFVEILADIIYFLWKWKPVVLTVLIGAVVILLTYQADSECSLASLDVENKVLRIFFLVACSFFGPN